VETVLDCTHTWSGTVLDWTHCHWAAPILLPLLLTRGNCPHSSRSSNQPLCFEIAGSRTPNSTVNVTSNHLDTRGPRASTRSSGIHLQFLRSTKQTESSDCHCTVWPRGDVGDQLQWVNGRRARVVSWTFLEGLSTARLAWLVEELVDVPDLKRTGRISLTFYVRKAVVTAVNMCENWQHWISTCWMHLRPDGGSPQHVILSGHSISVCVCSCVCVFNIQSPS
jgi:hypothetical protein